MTRALSAAFLLVRLCQAVVACYYAHVREGQHSELSEAAGAKKMLIETIVSDDRTMV